MGMAWPMAGSLLVTAAGAAGLVVVVGGDIGGDRCAGRLRGGDTAVTGRRRLAGAAWVL